MPISHPPPDSATPLRRSLFGTPALRPSGPRVIHAEAFRLAKSRDEVADVTLDLGGLHVRCLVRYTPHGPRFVWPSLRGAPAVLNTAERVRLQDLAAEAAQQVIGSRPMERAA